MFSFYLIFKVGLDYRHATGHGAGSLLNVHELPIISNRKNNELGLKENMILTIEPGYYEEGNFGIRIENTVRIVREKTKYNMSNGSEFLKFESLTYVPIQKELIEKSLLNEFEIKWINDYHERCLHVIGDELIRDRKFDVLAWLIEQTQYI